MRLMSRRKRRVTVHAPLEGTDGRRRQWGEGRAILAVIQPLKAAARDGQAGITREEKRLLLYDGEMKIEAGMGVCVDAESCDYVVTAVARFKAQVAEMTLIPESRR